MAGKDFEAFKQTIEQHLMGHPVVTQNAYTAWFAKGNVPLPHLREFTTQFSVFSKVNAVARPKINPEFPNASANPLGI